MMCGTQCRIGELSTSLAKGMALAKVKIYLYVRNKKKQSVIIKFKIYGFRSVIIGE